MRAKRGLVGAGAVGLAACLSFHCGNHAADSARPDTADSAATDAADSAPRDAADRTDNAQPAAPACDLSGVTLTLSAPAGTPLRAFLGIAEAVVPLLVILPSSVAAPCTLSSITALTDVNGAAVSTSTHGFIVTAGPNTLPVPLEPPDVGFYGVSITIPPGGAAQTYATSVGVLRPLTPLQAAEPASSDLFGVNTHFDEGEGDVDITPELIERAGIRWARDTIGWPGVEVTAGVYALPKNDQTAFANLAAKGTSVLGVLTYHNPSLYPPNGPTEAPAFASYAKYVASALTSSVPAFEIWNEPESNGLTPSQYVPILKSGYAGVKAGNPSATVIGIGGGSPGGFSGDYIGAIVEADASSQLDSFSIHPYVTPLNVDTGYVTRGGPTALANLTNGAVLTNGFASVIQMAKGESAPPGIWVTETGWPSNVVGLVAQAEELARTYALVRGLDPLYARVFIYDFLCDVSQSSPVEQNFGIVNLPDYSIRPAYVALATTTRALAGRPFVRRLTDPANDALQVFVFGPEDEPLVAAWAMELGPKELIAATAADASALEEQAHAGGNPSLLVPVSLQIAGATGVIHDWQDRETAVTAVGGALHVSLSPWPIFIEAAGTASSITLGP